ncbi:LacI family DNA-binding transcriptional regulator [Oribacterium sp. WCC10]|uniref:LacI family DNA-binding transcriptional regulator n=1 Tax=Oribacterium sp. WCC10 TaxID=1855343 RepID=UPI0008EDF742|nr:LacI family DNA-binding transcriptional regulator [Oribacterium sp. WCC10]SFG20663.1 transcriptional regulator, LacI family [Oribacterium sp. WCC10]
MTKRTVSLKDISNACGVSIATVSKALNDHSDISAEKKAQIKKTAAELGYRPNAAAQALKTNRTNNIGVLFVDEANSGLTHDYFSHVLDSFKQTAEKNGYDITFINSNRSDENRMSYLSHALYRGFDGVVIACVDFYDPEVTELVNSSIPVVTIDHMFDSCMSVQSDNVTGMKDLVTYIYKQGHKKIAYIHARETSSVTQSRLTCFYKTMQEFGLEIPDEYMISAPYRDTVKTYEATKKLLDLKNPPTCIICPDDFSSFGCMNAVRERGLRIPEDISIVGYDGIELARRISPRLTTLVQDTRKLGSLAAEKLIALINNPKGTLIEHLLVDGKLDEGESVAKIENQNTSGQPDEI